MLTNDVTFLSPKKKNRSAGKYRGFAYFSSSISPDITDEYFCHVNCEVFFHYALDFSCLSVLNWQSVQRLPLWKIMTVQRGAGHSTAMHPCACLWTHKCTNSNICAGMCFVCERGENRGKDRHTDGDWERNVWPKLLLTLFTPKKILFLKWLLIDDQLWYQYMIYFEFMSKQPWLRTLCPRIYSACFYCFWCIYNKKSVVVKIKA